MITVYEVKLKRVTINDIDQACVKIQTAPYHLNHYIFITTEVITEEITRYCAAFYEHSDGVEIAVLDCLSFLRHFLHLFYRLRMRFLDSYQQLMLSEPDSAVSQPVKEVFLVLRQAAESAD